MRKRDIILFFSIFFTLYGLINYYIFSHGWTALEHRPALLGTYAAAYWSVALAWVIGRFLERVRMNPVSSALIWFGSFWLAAMVYFLVIVLVVDAIRVVNVIVPFLPGTLFHPEAQETLLLAAIVLVAGVVTAGAINAATPRVKPLNLTIAKNTIALESLNIVVASDIHLGTIICKQRLERIVEKINSLDADLVLLPGDVVDEDLKPVIKQNLGETLRGIKARYGVFAVTGNHEYIGGVEPACAYLTEHGIRMLRDEVVTVADSVILAGREDVSFNRGTLRRRKPLKELINGVNGNLPIILMDHQPFRLHEAEEAGVDLQLSGHTHHGQLWPFNHITRKIYEVSWGYKQRGATHIYVSCGVGSWGPPVRIGNSPEIMHITLKFSGKSC